MSEDKENYSRIIKSSSLIGGAQGVSILIGLMRVKFAALLIGASGIGLISAYQSVLQLLGSVFGLGLRSSSVREISLAVANDDVEQISRTVVTLRRMSLLLGLCGAVIVVVFSGYISEVSFDSRQYSGEVALIGFGILLTNMLGAEMALIQGMRRIAELAKIKLVAALVGALISIFIYVSLGQSGVIYALLSMVLVELFFARWYSRRISLKAVKVSWRESISAGGGMARLGVAFMYSGLLTTGVAYATRVIVVREIDLVAVGIFSAAYALSGMLVNFVLGAMASDYYPSLTAVSSDHQKMRDLVNQQTEIGLLLALPGVLGTLIASPILIKLLYSSEFWQAELLLRWFIMGCMLRVITWPMGYIVLAVGAVKLYGVTQTVFNVLHMLLICLFLGLWGVEGVAFAFLMAYAVHVVFIYSVARYLIEFRWSDGAKALVALSFALMAVFSALSFLPIIWRLVLGLSGTVLVGLYCVRELVIRLGAEHRISQQLVSLPIVRILFR